MWCRNSGTRCPRRESSLLIAVLLVGCGGENTPSNVSPPGTETSAKTEALEAGANVLQDKAPLRKLNAYLDGFHFYNGRMDGQMEAHHYCGHLNEDLIQCVIFDGNGKDAKLMGIEYIVSRTLFEKLPREEKHLWHSHAHEVRSGSLIAPGIPAVAEHELMEEIAVTYGKTWHTWHTDRGDALPVGTPLLMMGFTQDGQLRQELLQERDRRFDISTQETRGQRTDIAYPPIDPDANAWEKGITMQLRVERQDAAPSPAYH
jgi:hypothetical protein